MRKIKAYFLVGIIALFSFNSCDKNKETPPELPPYESMAIDFSQFGTQKSAGNTETTTLNFFAAGATVLVWNATLTITLAVPVAAFYASFQSNAEYLGDGTWQWTYDVPGFAGAYHARMTGKLMDEKVKWEMYISKTGIPAHGEFLWFEGTSDFDGKGGQWILYHSYDLQEAVLQIDWTKTNNEIGNVKYTYIRESSNGDVNQLTAGSFLQYGLTDADLNAFYRIEFSNRSEGAENKSVDIEWSLTEFNGRIKAQHYFQDELWHCWDSQGYDVVCE